MNTSQAELPNTLIGRLALLRERTYMIMWSTGALASVVRWLELLAFGVYVFEVTRSPLYVALMTVVRMAPLALAGMFSGAIAEIVNRRWLMMVGFGLMLAQSLALGIYSLSAPVSLTWLAIASFTNGLFWTTDFSARRTIMAEAAGTHRMGVAMSLDSITSNGTRMLGPALGGALLQQVGLTGAFFIGVLFYAAGFVLLLFLHHPEPDTGGRERMRVLASMAQGLRYIRTNRALSGTLLVTIVFNLWGFPVTSMVPVIGKDILELNAFWVGMLMSAEGAGATIGALLITAWAKPQIYKSLYFYGVFLYLNMVLLFSHTLWPWLSGTLLLILGLGGAAFAAMQAVLVLTYSSSEYRGRTMGVLAVCIGLGPIGFVHLGLLAGAVGAQMATAIMAIEGIVALLLVALLYPEVD